MKTIANFYFLNKIDLNVPQNNIFRVLDNDRIIETSAHGEIFNKSSLINIIPYLQKALEIIGNKININEVFANKLGDVYVNDALAFIIDTKLSFFSIFKRFWVALKYFSLPVTKRAKVSSSRKYSSINRSSFDSGWNDLYFY